MVALVDLQKGIKTDNIDSAPELAAKFNAFATSLKDVHSAGKGIDNSLLMEIPVDMLEYLGEDVTNPEMYQHAASKQYESNAKKVSKRLHYLTSIDGNVSSLVNEGDAMDVEIKTEVKTE